MHELKTLVDRLNGQINNGYEMLKNIIHASLMGQTSPYILPPDQIAEVEREILESSNYLLDTKFSRMRSVVTSDPEDRTMLLVLVGTTTIARKNLELVHLVPIPHFGDHETVAPKLDYTYVVLDQEASKYAVLSEMEAARCLRGRCYVNNQPSGVLDGTCGIPQYYGDGLGRCEFHPVHTNGMFFQPLRPDGVVFALKGEVRTQPFCDDKSETGAFGKLKGTGVVQIPPGCRIVVTDSSGVASTIRGTPITKVVQTDGVTLVKHDMSHLAIAIRDRVVNSTGRLAQFQSFMNNQLNAVRSNISEVEEKVEQHTTHTWILYLVISLVILVVVALAIAAYYCSSRVQKLVNEAYAKVSSYDRLADTVKEQARETVRTLEGKVEQLRQQLRDMRDNHKGGRAQERKEPPWTVGPQRKPKHKARQFCETDDEGEGQAELKEMEEYINKLSMPPMAVSYEQLKWEDSQRSPRIPSRFATLPRSPAITFNPGTEVVRYNPRVETPSLEEELISVGQNPKDSTPTQQESENKKSRKDLLD
jgi:F0F1-type ATP synthase membrane subunit b/b'